MSEKINKMEGIQREELENVSGGSCYSGDTYSGLGLIHKYNPQTQGPDNNPLITTTVNCCGSYEPKDPDELHWCNGCKWYVRVFSTSYCLTRSKQTDK